MLACQQDSGYLVKDGLLFHRSNTINSKQLLQLVIPKTRCAEIIRVAHGAPAARNFGKKTNTEAVEKFDRTGLDEK